MRLLVLSPLLECEGGCGGRVEGKGVGTDE